MDALYITRYFSKVCSNRNNFVDNPDQKCFAGGLASAQTLFPWRYSFSSSVNLIERVYLWGGGRVLRYEFKYLDWVISAIPLMATELQLFLLLALSFFFSFLLPLIKPIFRSNLSVRIELSCYVVGPRHGISRRQYLKPGRLESGRKSSPESLIPPKLCFWFVSRWETEFKRYYFSVISFWFVS
jgi:hypothetical protein